MAMDVYDQLAVAVQAVMAEREASEYARAEKVRASLARSGHWADYNRFLAAMEEEPPKATAKK